MRLDIDTSPDDARSAQMRLISSKDTKPEMIIRRALYRSGFRYRIHYKALPGRPDIVFPKRKKAIFIHGCFWHRHHGCSRSRMPKTRVAYWTEKFRRNIDRDEVNLAKIKALGWSVMIVWECEIQQISEVMHKLSLFINSEQEIPEKYVMHRTRETKRLKTQQE